MRRTSLIAVLAGLAAVAALAQDASARNRMYHPGLGRFIQRDPLGTPFEPSTERHLSDSQYTQPDPTVQYADSMSLYEYCEGSPVQTGDPSGRFAIVIGGAGGIGDAGIVQLATKMAEKERAWYKQNRPRTILTPGKGYEFISLPTGGGPGPLGQLSALGFPDWQNALTRLEQAIARYEMYRLLVEGPGSALDFLHLPRCQAEKLHIIGYSDGATTISLWLNRAKAQRHPYGLIMIVDLVRRANTLNGTFPNGLAPGAGQSLFGDLPNLWTHTPLDVPRSANAKMYRAIAHQTPLWALWSPEAGWTGHFLTGWEGNRLVKDNKKHSEFPWSTDLREDALEGLREALDRFSSGE